MWTATTLVRLMVSWWYRATRPKDAAGARRMAAASAAGWRRPLFRLDPGRHAHPLHEAARGLGLLVSAVLSTASLVGAFYPGLEKGIDFKGGIVMEVRTPGPADLARAARQRSPASTSAMSGCRSSASRARC